MDQINFFPDPWCLSLGIPEVALFPLHAARRKAVGLRAVERLGDPRYPYFPETDELEQSFPVKIDASLKIQRPR